MLHFCYHRLSAARSSCAGTKSDLQRHTRYVSSASGSYHAFCFIGSLRGSLPRSLEMVFWL